MTPIRPAEWEKAINPAYFHFPGVEFSWAGEGPDYPLIWLGSENGRLMFTKGVDDKEGWGIDFAAESAEAINGVTFSGDWIALSTRHEVALEKEPNRPGGDSLRSKYPGGAHGVISTQSGTFVAPMGTSGLLSVSPRGGDFQVFKTMKVVGRTINFYKAVSLGANPQGDVLFCAARRDGLATVVPGVASGAFRVLTYPGLDAVDACTLGSPEFPFAAASVGLDGSVHLFQDVLDPSAPQRMRIEGLSGKAYRILSARGHLFLLTSEFFYTMPNLVSEFLAGRNVYGSTWLGGVEIRAVDVSVAFDEWLLFVMPEGGVAVVQVEELAATKSPTSYPGVTRTDLPDWEIQSAFDLTFADTAGTFGSSS